MCIFVALSTFPSSALQELGNDGRGFCHVSLGLQGVGVPDLLPWGHQATATVVLAPTPRRRTLYICFLCAISGTSVAGESFFLCTIHP